MATGLEKVSFHSSSKENNAKECSNYRTIVIISHARKVILKNLQARLQQYMNCELADFKLILEKAEELEIKLPTSAGSWKRQESSRKTSTSSWLCQSLCVQFSSVQSLSRVRLFATPWIAARQASLSITNCRCSLRRTSIESVMPSSHLILSSPSPPASNPSQHQSLFEWVNSLHEVAKVLQFQL